MRASPRYRARQLAGTAGAIIYGTSAARSPHGTRADPLATAPARPCLGGACAVAGLLLPRHRRNLALSVCRTDRRRHTPAGGGVAPGLDQPARQDALRRPRRLRLAAD